MRAVVALLLLLVILMSGTADSTDSVGSASGRARFAIIADTQNEGERGPTRAALADLDARGAERLLFLGDTTYEWGGPPDDWLDALGTWREEMWMVVGNHDDGDQYVAWMPTTMADGSERSHDQTFWTARIDDVVLVGIDTERGLHPNDEQREWLEGTLARHADDTVVLLAHIPWWVTNARIANENGFYGDPADMDALIAQHDVDLVINAHEHYYARTSFNGTPYVLHSATDANVRVVPAEMERRAEVTASVQTWAHLDIMPCAVALDVLTETGRLDRVVVRRAEAPSDAGEPIETPHGVACRAPPTPPPNVAPVPVADNDGTPLRPDPRAQARRAVDAPAWPALLAAACGLALKRRTP